MRKTLSISIFFLLLVKICMAQTGEEFAYKFMNYKFSAQLAGLGGSLIATWNNDPSLILYNPSTIAPKFNSSLSVNAADYFANTGYTSAMYSQTFNKIGSFAAEIRYIGYGTFVNTDDAGYELGTFTCNDIGLTLGWGRRLDSCFSIGANLKMMFSGYESYSSFGLAVDVAGSYHNEKYNCNVALLVKNIGREIKPFVSGVYKWAPFDIQLAFSQRFKFIPIRYHISVHSLYKWKMSYVGANDPTFEIDVMTDVGNYPSKFNQEVNNLFRHITFGLEFIPSKYFSLFLSYNHNQNRAMRITQKKTMAGFAYGFLIDIKSIQFGFSRSHYTVGATPNYFTFSLNINELSELSKEKKQKKLQRVN